VDKKYKPKKAERLITSEEEGSLIVFDSDSGSIKVLNETAALVWNWIDGETTVEDLIEMVVRENPDEKRDTIEEDVMKFVTDLQQNRFIET
jgi:hypothetical protein